MNEPESVSDHMYRMATLSFLVDPNSGLNREKYLKPNENNFKEVHFTKDINIYANSDI